MKRSAAEQILRQGAPRVHASALLRSPSCQDHCAATGQPYLADFLVCCNVMVIQLYRLSSWQVLQREACAAACRTRQRQPSTGAQNKMRVQGCYRRASHCRSGQMQKKVAHTPWLACCGHADNQSLGDWLSVVGTLEEVVLQAALNCSMRCPLHCRTDVMSNQHPQQAVGAL